MSIRLRARNLIFVFFVNLILTVALLAAGLVRSVRIDGSRRVPVEALETYVAALLDREEPANAEAS